MSIVAATACRASCSDMPFAPSASIAKQRQSGPSGALAYIRKRAPKVWARTLSSDVPARRLATDSTDQNESTWSIHLPEGTVGRLCIERPPSATSTICFLKRSHVIRLASAICHSLSTCMLFSPRSAAAAAAVAAICIFTCLAAICSGCAAQAAAICSASHDDK